jgi:membrane-associated phospholipid phosphatase
MARIISVIFHPLIMPAVGLLLLFNSGTYLEFMSYQQQRAIFIIYFTGTIILPLSIIPVVMLQRMVTSIRMETHHERVFPLMMTVIFYGFTWYMLSRLRVPGLISMYTMAASVAIFIVAMVSLKWKISLHMTAQGALAGLLLATTFRYGVNLQFFLSIVFLVGGITGWARLSLKAHTPAQVYTGYLTGLAILFIMIFYF